MGEQWSLPDEFLFALAHQMRDEGVWQRVFYDGRTKSGQEFFELLKHPSNLPVFFFEGIEPLGFAWLNGIMGEMAFAHFCGLRAARHKTTAIGRLVLDYWMSNFDFLRLILGLTPANNKLAVRFIEKIGFTVLGEIPGVLHDAYEGERVGGVVSYYLR